MAFLRETRGGPFIAIDCPNGMFFCDRTYKENRIAPNTFFTEWSYILGKYEFYFRKSTGNLEGIMEREI